MIEIIAISRLRQEIKSEHFIIYGCLADAGAALHHITS